MPSSAATTWRYIATVRRSLRASTATTCSRTASVTGRVVVRNVCLMVGIVNRLSQSVTRSTTRTVVITTTTNTVIVDVIRPSVAGTDLTAMTTMMVMLDSREIVEVELPMGRSSSLFSFHRRNSARFVRMWLGGVLVSVSDSLSKGRGFDSRPAHRQATTLDKLLTPMCLCLPSCIIWYLARAFTLTVRMWLSFTGPMNKGSIVVAVLKRS